MSNASNLSTLANVLDDGSSGQFLKSTGSGGVAFDTVAAGAVVYATADLLPLSGFAAGDMAYVTATNRFYINNGSGWYSISLVNTNPNITSVADASSGTTPFTLATDQTATVITITAADPEDVPLTYGYSVTSGSLNGSTVAQGTGSNTNVFTVTPHASQDATFTITFTASDGINQATSANAFSLSFITIVTDSNHTTLLATATGTSDNNNITDSSSNSHSITVTGDAYAGTFSPYRSGGYSLKFNGTANNYIQVQQWPRSNLGTNDFTVECFVYPTNDSSRICDLLPGSAGLFRFSTFTGGNLALDINKQGVGSFDIRTTGGNINYNAWNHVAVCRSGTSLKLYSNGSLIHTESGGDWDYGTGDAYSNIGRWNTTGDVLNGYISNFRIKNSALYTGSTYTVPTEGFTSDTGTTLLVGAGAVIDNVTPYGVVIYGTVTSEPFSPYDYVEYSATDNGGSVYFDRVAYNSGACITVADHNDFTLGTSDWTVKFWVYHNELDTSAGNSYGYFSNYYFNTPGGFGLKWMQQHGNKPVLEYMNSGSYANKIFDFVPSAKKWYYYELTCSSSSVTFKVNGDTIGTQSVPDLGNPDRTLIVGAASNGSSAVENYLGGYIADFQYVIGGTASESSVPIAPMSTDTNSKLHITGTDASIIDKSQGTNLKLEGSTTGSTTQVKFAGTKSMKFDSVDDKISVSGVLDLSQACTWEAWVYFDNHPDASGFMHMFQSASYSSTTPPFGIRFKTTGSAKINFVLYTTSGDHEVSSNAVALDTWHHLAFSRTSSGVYNIYLNGTRYATFTESATYQSAGDVMVIGNSGTGTTTARHLDGYMQDIRITQGLARYTAADESANIPTAPLEG